MKHLLTLETAAALAHTDEVQGQSLLPAPQHATFCLRYAETLILVSLQITLRQTGTDAETPLQTMNVREIAYRILAWTLRDTGVRCEIPCAHISGRSVGQPQRSGNTHEPDGLHAVKIYIRDCFKVAGSIELKHPEW